MTEEKKFIINEIKNSGFIYEPEKPQDYILGVNSPLAEPPIIFPDGHSWPEYRAKAEMQFNRSFDSYSCTLYATLKAMVAYLKEVYNYDTTMSEMFNAYFADVVPGRGTTIRNAMESPRKYGWVEDAEYPFTAETTQTQFFSKPPQSIILKAKGKLTEWEVHWEQLDASGNVPHNKIIDCLKRAPVVCSGFAWASYYGEGIYQDYNNPANHAFLVDDWSDNKDYDLIVYDSYPQDNIYDDNSPNEEFVKKLAKDYKIWSAHRIWLTPIKKNLILNLKNMLTTCIRDLRGGFWFVKDKKRQKINKTSLDIMTVLSVETGIKTISDEELNKYQETTEFYPVI